MHTLFQRIYRKNIAFLWDLSISFSNLSPNAPASIPLRPDVGSNPSSAPAASGFCAPTGFSTQRGGAWKPAPAVFFLFRVPLRLVDQPEIHLGAGHDAALIRSTAEGIWLLLCQLPDPFPCQCRRIKAQARLLPHGRIWSFKIGIERAVQNARLPALRNSITKTGYPPHKAMPDQNGYPVISPGGSASASSAHRSIPASTNNFPP